MKNPRRARGSYCRYRGASVSSVRGPLAQHLRDEILLGSLELHLLHDGQSITADDMGPAPFYEISTDLDFGPRVIRTASASGAAPGSNLFARRGISESSLQLLAIVGISTLVVRYAQVSKNTSKREHRWPHSRVLALQQPWNVPMLATASTEVFAARSG